MHVPCFFLDVCLFLFRFFVPRPFATIARPFCGHSHDAVCGFSVRVYIAFVRKPQIVGSVVFFELCLCLFRCFVSRPFATILRPFCGQGARCWAEHPGGQLAKLTSPSHWQGLWPGTASVCVCVCVCTCLHLPAQLMLKIGRAHV